MRMKELLWENSKGRLALVLVALIAVSSILLYQNCSGGFRTVGADSLQAGSSNSTEQQVLQPPAPPMDNSGQCQSGETQMGYERQSVTSPDTCGQPLTKTCVNGLWDRNVTLFASCQVTNPPVPTTTVPLTPPQLNRVTVMSGLQNPWDLAFAADGTLFFTEKCRGLSVRLNNGQVRRLFGTSGSVLVAPDLFCESQSGMQGVTLDPDFQNNRYLYVFMSSNQSSPKTNRVIRLTVSADMSSVSNRTDLVTNIAYKNNGNSWGGPGAHSGGRLRFGPDGFLYIVTGDNHNGLLPQSPTLLGGKVLRIDRNGNAAPGNNATAGRDPRIFAYGFRNPQGLTFRPGMGQAFIAEHGPGHNDEVTALLPGGNGGWDPVPAPGVSCNDNYCGYESNRPDGRLTSMTDLEKFPNALKPIWNNRGQSEGICDAAFLSGPQWKAWNGRLAVSFLRGARVDVLTLAPDATVTAVVRMDLPAERIRALVPAPDGSLYVSTDSGNIWKVTPN